MEPCTQKLTFPHFFYVLARGTKIYFFRSSGIIFISKPFILQLSDGHSAKKLGLELKPSEFLKLKAAKTLDTNKKWGGQGTWAISPYLIMYLIIKTILAKNLVMLKSAKHLGVNKKFMMDLQKKMRNQVVFELSLILKKWASNLQKLLFGNNYVAKILYAFQMFWYAFRIVW